MRETGTIISVDGEFSTIRIDKTDQCQGCTACKSLGNGVLQVDAFNKIGAQPGDTVEIEIESAKILRHSFIVFIFPLFMLVAGYLLGLQFTKGINDSGEEAGIIGAVMGLVLSFIVIRLYDRIKAKDHTHSAQVVTLIHRS